ncbi:MAG: alpha-hydroxy-acid oxidizing protein [Eubacteriales bacterium]|nr:alpha-hydroxy-acid oxidizing protein [Eubacteriales bacterium]
MTYEEMIKQARFEMGPYCKSCPVCDGRACKNTMPGPGAKGVGDVAIRNYEQWQRVRVNMDTIGENVEPDTRINLFGHSFAYPFFAGPVGAMRLHYGDKYDDEEYNRILVSACMENGIAAFTGDGANPEVFKAASAAIKDNDGIGIPTIKPWNVEMIHEKLDMVEESEAIMVAMDIDAAGLPFLKNTVPPAGNKTVEELSMVIHDAERPFILKGIMTVKGAKKAYEAGASAIVVSNHGGRVLDQTPSTAEVLEEIVSWNEGRMKIFVDGGIRTGMDVFKAIAMGADAVLIARPFVQAVYGGQSEGVRLYIEKLAAELRDTMAMCGAKDIKSISRKMVRR